MTPVDETTYQKRPADSAFFGVTLTGPNGGHPGGLTYAFDPEFGFHSVTGPLHANTTDQETDAAIAEISEKLKQQPKISHGGTNKIYTWSGNATTLTWSVTAARPDTLSTRGVVSLVRSEIAGKIKARDTAKKKAGF